MSRSMIEESGLLSEAVSLKVSCQITDAECPGLDHQSQLGTMTRSASKHGQMSKEWSVAGGEDPERTRWEGETRKMRLLMMQTWVLGNYCRSGVYILCFIMKKQLF